MGCFSKMGPNQLIILNALLSIFVSDDLSAEDLNILGNFLAAFSSQLLTKAAQLEAQKSRQDAKEQLQDLQRQMDKIKKNLRL